MSSKRRKLDSPIKPQLSAVSAFAARKAHAAAQSNSSSQKEISSSQNNNERISQQVTNDVPSRTSNRGKRSPVKIDLPSMSPGFIVEENGRGEALENHISSHLK